MSHVVRPQGDVVMFSKAANNAPRVVGAAISEADANKLIVSAVRAVGGSVPGITFKTVPTFANLPASIQDAATDKDTGKVSVVYGATSSGVVYVVLDAHQSKEDIEKTVFHELYGYVGLGKLFGSKIITELNKLYHQVGGVPGIRAIAAKHGIKLDHYIRDANRALVKRDLDVEQRNRVIIEELLAHIAEKGPSFKQAVRAIIGMVRAALRRMGMTLAKRNDADLAHILAQARGAMGRNGILRSVDPTGMPTTLFRHAEAGRTTTPPATITPKNGLLDTPLRLALQKTGALSVWRGAFRVLEKAVSASLNNRVGELIKAA